MSHFAEPSNSTLVEYAAEQAHPKPQLLQPAAASPKSAGGSSVFRWIASKARSVGGACFHVIASPGAGTLIFTSVCLVLAYQHRKASSSRSREPAARSVSRTISFAMLQGGQKAMERFREILGAATGNVSVLTKSVKDALEYIRNELREESWKTEDELQNKQLNFVKLYGQIGILEMSGQENEAIEVLKKALEKIKGHTHNKHEIELLLVEMLIFKGAYDEALTKTCLSSEEAGSPADPRVPLYKAIIYCMKEKEGEAEENYKKFKDVRDNFHWPKVHKMDNSMFCEVPGFEDFKKMVKSIKEEIVQLAHEAAKPSSTPAAPKDKEKTTATAVTSSTPASPKEKEKTTATAVTSSTAAAPEYKGKTTATAVTSSTPAAPEDQGKTTATAVTSSTPGSPQG